MKGDHIYVLCDTNILAYQHTFQHHGIDCGDGTVIHFSKRRRKIVHDPMCRFKSISKDGVVHTYNSKKCYSPSVVVQRAMNKLGETEYNLGLNNCEHFASWCRTDRWESQQIGGVLGTVGGTATVAGLGAAVGAIEVTTAASGIWGVLGMTTTAPLLGIGALPVAAICGGAFLAYKFLTHDETHNRS
jgi:hypothetical protein